MQVKDSHSTAYSLNREIFLGDVLRGLPVTAPYAKDQQSVPLKAEQPVLEEDRMV